MIIASVVTIPNRLELLKDSLKSLLLSSIKPDFVYISISKWYPRLQKSYLESDLDSLNEFLKTFEIPSKIVMYEKDLGPCLKFFTPIRNHDFKQDDYILVFDDDNGLFPGAIDELIGCARATLSDGVYSLAGIAKDNTWHLNGEYIQGGDYYPIRLLGGYRGCLYPVRLFNLEDLIDYLLWIIKDFSSRGDIPLHDDHIISAYCESRGIPIKLARVKNNPMNYEQISASTKNPSDGIMHSKAQDINFGKLYTLLLTRGINFPRW